MQYLFNVTYSTTSDCHDLLCSNQFQYPKRTHLLKTRMKKMKVSASVERGIGKK